MTTRRWLPATTLAVLWIALATIDGGTTYHLAPVIVAAAPGAVGRTHRLAWSTAGTLSAATVALALATFGHLEGPTLLPVGGALLESVVGAVVGGAAGLVLAGRLDATEGDRRA